MVWVNLKEWDTDSDAVIVWVNLMEWDTDSDAVIVWVNVNGILIVMP